MHSCSKSSISVGKDARMNQSSFCLSCVLQSLLKVHSEVHGIYNWLLAYGVHYIQIHVIAKIHVHHLDVQWKGLNQFCPYWAIGIWDHLKCFLVNFCDNGCLCIEYILSWLCRFCIWNVVVKSIFRSLNKVSDYLSPSWANQKQSIFFTGLCEDHCIVCVCTCPNPFSCYLKVVLHLKYSAQIILLLWWSCLNFFKSWVYF